MRVNSNTCTNVRTVYTCMHSYGASSKQTLSHGSLLAVRVNSNTCTNVRTVYTCMHSYGASCINEREASLVAFVMCEYIGHLYFAKSTVYTLTRSDM